MASDFFRLLLDLEPSRNSISMPHPIKPYVPYIDVLQLTKTENTEAATISVLLKKLFLKFRNIHRKTPVLKSLFNKEIC